MQILGGGVTGALSLGNGTGGSLTIGQDDPANNIEQTAVVSGPVTFTGSGLAISVANGSLINTSATTLNLSSLNVGAKGTLYAAV